MAEKQMVLFTRENRFNCWSVFHGDIQRALPPVDINFLQLLSGILLSMKPLEVLMAMSAEVYQTESSYSVTTFLSHVEL